jgi:ATP-dependent exoDNAse (exonuclease V) beta subunit
VGRMVALVRAGREVDRIAAVTFTRKAAAELRERFQEALEKAYREAVAAGDEAGRARFGLALDPNRPRHRTISPSVQAEQQVGGWPSKLKS